MVLASITGSKSGFFPQDTAVSCSLLEKAQSHQRVTGFQYQQESKSKGITKKARHLHCMWIQDNAGHVKR